MERKIGKRDIVRMINAMSVERKKCPSSRTFFTTLSFPYIFFFELRASSYFSFEISSIIVESKDLLPRTETISLGSRP